MPTSRPRVMVTLTHELASVLDRISAGTGQSRSATVLEFLQIVQPAIEQTAQALDTLKNIKPEARAKLMAHIERHERVGSSILDAGLGNLAAMTAMLDEARTDPPSVNKGGSTPPVRLADTPETGSKVVPIKPRRKPTQQPLKGV